MENATKLLYWVLGVLVAMVIGGATAQISNSGRLSVLETILPYLTQRLDSIDRKLDRLDQTTRK